MRIQYGAVDVEIDRWVRPTEEIFERWTADFLALEDTRWFDVHLVGGFLEKINGKRPATTDVDIVLTRCDDLDRIERLIVEGTRLGMEKYQVFFDVLWFDHLPLYSEEATSRCIYIASNQWIVNSEVRRTYKDAIPLGNSLWKMNRRFPTGKMKKLLEGGYTYCVPLLLSTKTRPLPASKP